MSAGIFFSLIVTGQLESAYFPDHYNLYCKFMFTHGPDWVIISGLEEGITQMAVSSPTPSSTATDIIAKTCVWNFPIEIAFKSTNAYGWPQIVMCVYGLDYLGRDVIRGYGTIRLPRASGRHTVYANMFVPIANSPFNSILGYFTGRLPEFLDPKFVSKGDGREVTRVRSQGAVKVQLNISIKNAGLLGYVFGGEQEKEKIKHH